MSRLAYRRVSWLVALLVGVSASAVASGGPSVPRPIVVSLPALPADAPGGYVISAFSDGGSWHVLDPSTGRYEQTAFQVNAVSPNLRYALVADHTRRAGVLSTTARTVIRWFSPTFAVPLGWSPDGRWIALGNAIGQQCKTDCDFADRIRFVDVTSGEHRDVSIPRQPLVFFQPPTPWTTDGKIVIQSRLVGVEGTAGPVPADLTAGRPLLGTDDVVLLHPDTRDSVTFPQGAITPVQVDPRTGARTLGRRLDGRRIDAGRVQAWLSRTEAVLTTGSAELVVLQIATGVSRRLARLPRPADELRIQRRAHVTGDAVVF